jgi:hypothetical protein
MIAMKSRRTKTHTSEAQQWTNAYERAAEGNVSNGEKERKTLLYIESDAYVNTQQTTQKRNQKSTIFPSYCVRLHTSGEGMETAERRSSSAPTHTEGFIENVLIEGDTSAQFYCRNLFLPINKLHKLFASRETCYQGNLWFLLLQFGLGIGRQFMRNLKVTKSHFGIVSNVHGSLCDNWKFIYDFLKLASQLKRILRPLGRIAGFFFRWKLSIDYKVSIQRNQES